MIGLILAAALYCNPHLPPGHTASGTTAFDGQPPRRFQSVPVTATITIVPANKISSICDAPDDLPPCPLRTQACTAPDGHVYLPDPRTVGAEEFTSILTHELGHVLGWRGDHPR